MDNKDVWYFGMTFETYLSSLMGEFVFKKGNFLIWEIVCVLKSAIYDQMILLSTIISEELRSLLDIVSLK